MRPNRSRVILSSIFLIAAMVCVWAGSGATVTAATRSSPPGFNALDEVAGTSPTDVWAVGYQEKNFRYRTLILHWDGSSWARFPSPNPAANNELLGVAAASATDAWAVGHSCADPCHVRETLTLHWDGTSWSEVPSPSPGAADNVLNGVSASSTGDAWAVGDACDVEPCDGVAMAFHWDGTAWYQVPVPAPGLSSQLYALTGAGRQEWAVGSFATNSGLRTLALRWNGTAWKRAQTSDPGTYSTLRGVSPFPPQTSGRWGNTVERAPARSSPLSCTGMGAHGRRFQAPTPRPRTA